MKIYYFMNPNRFANCYIVANEKTKDAIIIDPSTITESIINQLERNSYKLSYVLVTHNHESHVQGIKTLIKIYSPKILGADWEIAGKQTSVITGDGKIKIAGFTVYYMSVPGHSSDSMVYKIGNVIFTGDVLSAGKIGSTNSSYANHLLRTNISQKIFSQQDNTVIFPGHGPPTSVAAEKLVKYEEEFHKSQNILPPPLSNYK